MIAGLARKTVVPFSVDTIYSSSNRTIEDEAWNSPSLLPDTGLVALSDEWIRSKELPKAQRFPWDKSKGIYLLNGFHNMHCLVRPVALASSVIVDWCPAHVTKIDPRSIRRSGTRADSRTCRPLPRCPPGACHV